MKKISMLITLSLAVLLALAGCARKADMPERDAASECTVAEGVTARLEQSAYPIGAAGLTAIIENRTDTSLTLSPEWSFEKYSSGSWEALGMKEGYTFPTELTDVADHDALKVSLTTDCLSEPLSAGFYRVTLPAPSASGTVEGAYQPIVLEFTVEKKASAEPAATAAPLGEWEFPAKEDWQLYSAAECGEVYANAGYTVWECTKLSDGLLAVLYRESAGDGDAAETGDLFLLDLVDRSSGQRCTPFDSAVTELGCVAPRSDAGADVLTSGGEYFVDVQGGALVLTPPQLVLSIAKRIYPADTDDIEMSIKNLGTSDAEASFPITLELMGADGQYAELEPGSECMCSDFLSLPHGTSTDLGLFPVSVYEGGGAAGNYRISVHAMNPDGTETVLHALFSIAE